ncbi:MAG: hypothetical protein ABDH91_09050 [Bacteroidia bacterium]
MRPSPLLFLLALGYAQKDIVVPFTLADRERLIQVEAEQHTLRREMESLRREMDGLRKEMDGLRKEMDGLRKEMDGLRREMDGLREEMNALRSFMVALVTTQVAIVIGIFGGIGYLIWDRRQTLRPLRKRLARLERQRASGA